MIAGAALAASMQISSTRVLLSSEQPIASLQVRNDGDVVLGVQVQLMAWSQDGKGDVHVPIREVLANPPIFRVAPGAAQVLRLGWQAVQPQTTEGSYRLFVQELPREDAKPGEIQTLLRFSVPVFTTVPESRPVLQWQVLPGEGTQSALLLSNQGSRHIQITRLRAMDEQGDVLLDRDLSVYVLPRQTQQLPVSLPARRAGQTVRLDVATDYNEGVAPAVVQVRHAGAQTR